MVFVCVVFVHSKIEENKIEWKKNSKEINHEEKYNRRTKMINSVRFVWMHARTHVRTCLYACACAYVYECMCVWVCEGPVTYTQEHAHEHRSTPDKFVWYNYIIIVQSRHFTWCRQQQINWYEPKGTLVTYL